MKQVLYTLRENRPVTGDVWRMVLLGDTSAITAPGQFVNVRIDGLYLRRPISVCDWDGDGLTLIYKVVGRGTAALARMAPGGELDKEYQSLAAFAKTKTLAPGESQEVELSFDLAGLASFRERDGAFVLEPGEYPATVYFKAYREEDQTFIGQAGAAIKITVLS